MGFEKRLECRILPKGEPTYEILPLLRCRPSGWRRFFLPRMRGEPAKHDRRTREKHEQSATDPDTATENRKAAPKKVKQKRKQKEPQEQDTESYSAQDDGYDGYYDDVLPADAGRLNEGIDMELVKKICAVTGVMLLIITLCVVAMYLL